MVFDSPEKQFIKNIKNLQFTDILAFAQILQVDEKDVFEDFLVDIVYAFSQQPKDKKKHLLKLAKDVAADNKRQGAAQKIQK